MKPAAHNEETYRIRRLNVFGLRCSSAVPARMRDYIAYAIAIGVMADAKKKTVDDPETGDIYLVERVTA